MKESKTKIDSLCALVPNMDLLQWSQYVMMLDKQLVSDSEFFAILKQGAQLKSKQVSDLTKCCPTVSVRKCK